MSNTKTISARHGKVDNMNCWVGFLSENTNTWSEKIFLFAVQHQRKVYQVTKMPFGFWRHHKMSSDDELVDNTGMTSEVKVAIADMKLFQVE